MAAAKLKEASVTKRKAADPESVDYPIEYQPTLVEEAVLWAMPGHPLETVFRSERDAVYAIVDAEVREDAFQTLHQRWFERLNLDQPVRDTLEYWLILKERTSRCVVLKAHSKKEIGAELFVANSQDKSDRKNHSIVIQLTSELLIQTELLGQFLHRELLHIVDMLDPEFGYQPQLPKSDFGPTYDRLLQDRYRVLWDIVVDGRLIQSGFLPASVQERHWRTFKKTFPGAGQDLRKVFDFFVSTATPRHQELVSFALSPETWLADNDARSNSKGICPLCHFPSFALKDVAANLHPWIVSKIQNAHDDWTPDRPVCQQCLDLYDMKHSQQA
ncbi:MAG: hypothetical protein ACE5G1_15940 [bacterium]